MTSILPDSITEALLEGGLDSGLDITIEPPDSPLAEGGEPPTETTGTVPAGEVIVPARPPRPERRRNLLVDPAGADWHARARAAVEAAAEGHAPRLPSLPDFKAEATEHVGRQILGRFLYDPGAYVVHDTTAVTAACAIPSAPASVLFIHFASELAIAVPDDADDCDHCIPEA